MKEKTSIQEIEKAAAEKAWELARIILEHPTRGGMTYEDVTECFGIPKLEPTTAVFRMSYGEAGKKYDTWSKEHKKVIRIGDEVEIVSLTTTWAKMVVTKMRAVPDDEGGMSTRDLIDCFGYMTMGDIFGLSYKEAREKYITWCKKKEDEIHAGDEVETLEGIYIKTVATKVTENTVEGISFDGQVHTRFISKVKKTGRRYSLIVDLLKDWAELDEWAKGYL